MSSPNIVISNKQKDLPLFIGSVRKVVLEFLFFSKTKTDEISIQFVTEKRIKELHEEFFDDPNPTDCISFPIDSNEKVPYHILGEIFICPKMAIDFIAKKGRFSESEVYKEITLYLVHGLLHLIGFNDQAKNEKRQMRYLEKKYMGHLSTFIYRKKGLTK